MRKHWRGTSHTFSDTSMSIKNFGATQTVEVEICREVAAITKENLKS
jgi:hypothetical protein